MKTTTAAETKVDIRTLEAGKLEFRGPSCTTHVERVQKCIGASESWSVDLFVTEEDGSIDEDSGYYLSFKSESIALAVAAMIAEHCE